MSSEIQRQTPESLQQPVVDAGTEITQTDVINKVSCQPWLLPLLKSYSVIYILVSLAVQDMLMKFSAFLDKNGPPVPIPPSPENDEDGGWEDDEEVVYEHIGI